MRLPSAQDRKTDPSTQVPIGSPVDRPLAASALASAAHRTVALQKNGGGRIQCQADRIPVEFRGLRQAVFGWLSYVAKDTFLTLA